MNKNIIIAIIVIALVLIGAWWWMGQSGTPAYAPTTEQEAPGAGTSALEADNTASISQELDSVDTGDLDAEFQSIDADLNNL